MVVAAACLLQPLQPPAALGARTRGVGCRHDTIVASHMAAAAKALKSEFISPAWNLTRARGTGGAQRRSMPIQVAEAGDKSKPEQRARRPPARAKRRAVRRIAAPGGDAGPNRRKPSEAQQRLRERMESARRGRDAPGGDDARSDGSGSRRRDSRAGDAQRARRLKQSLDQKETGSVRSGLFGVFASTPPKLTKEGQLLVKQIEAYMAKKGSRPAAPAAPGRANRDPRALRRSGSTAGDIRNVAQRRFMERQAGSFRSMPRSMVRKLSDATDTNPLLDEDDDDDEYAGGSLQRRLLSGQREGNAMSEFPEYVRLSDPGQWTQEERKFRDLSGYLKGGRFKLPFGRYKGMLLHNVCSHDPQYVKWMAGTALDKHASTGICYGAVAQVVLRDPEIKLKIEGRNALGS